MEKNIIIIILAMTTPDVERILRDIFIDMKKVAGLVNREHL